MCRREGLILIWFYGRVVSVKRSIKNYIKWMGVKRKIHNNGIVRTIREGEIWWAAVGENVGVEIDGKNEKYSRPILILRKFSNLFFLATPLTSRPHKGTWYQEFIFQNRFENAVLVQTKPMDVKRLYQKMGEVSKGDYKKILDAYLGLFGVKICPNRRLGWAGRSRIYSYCSKLFKKMQRQIWNNRI